MQTKEHKNNHKIVDYSAILEKKYGKVGTPKRIASEEKAFAFFAGQIIEQARKNAKMTQSELAEKVGTNKSYISRVETGATEPKISTFYRIVSALGLSIDLNPVN
jgi:DNA-binding XRE family transcriptional regulator